MNKQPVSILNIVVSSEVAMEKHETLQLKNSDLTFVIKGINQEDNKTKILLADSAINLDKVAVGQTYVAEDGTELIVTEIIWVSKVEPTFTSYADFLKSQQNI